MSFLNFQLELSRKNLIKWLFLKGLSLVYTGLVKIWLITYRTGLKTQWSSEKPVISVGNITLGGTGKTPMVDWLLTYLTEKGLQPAVLTRGYKAQRSEKHQLLNRDTVDAGSCEQYGDEPWFMFHQHPEISFFVSADRIESARRAQKSADILLLDDGMQHLRLKRDLEIVLVDAVSGIGNGRLIPLGPLREPLDSLSRADVVIYTKSNLASPQRLKDRLDPFLKADTRQFNSEFIPDQLLTADNSKPLSPKILTGKACLLFSGIGNPDGFVKSVSSTGADVIDSLIFSDHQAYTPENLRQIKHFAGMNQYDYLICTEKDWVKLETCQQEIPPVHRLKMKLSIDPGFSQFLDDWLEADTGGGKRP